MEKSDRVIKILLVDDEEEFVTTLAQRLEFRGFMATAVKDGQSGLDALSHDDYHIVILDLMMPGMDGLETLKQIKAKKPDQNVILLTGHGSTKAGIEGMKLGAADYLMKPIDIKELIERISETF